MKKNINYEKDILFKTNIGEICSISLEHDFTIDNGYLKGDFIVSGEYKTNELSINKESFNYRLPLEYELEKDVDLSTFSYEVENFEYNVHEDELNVYIDLGVRYELANAEPTIPEAEEIDFNDFELPLLNTEVETSTVKEEAITEEEGERLKEEDENLVLNGVMEDDNYITYHVHIIREGETLESIALKYNVSVDLIKEYNTIDNLEIKSKLIIPDVENE